MRRESDRISKNDLKVNRLLTVQEIADYLQVRPSTIYQWTHQGFIPHVKLGNRIRFRLSQVDRWLEKKTVEGRKAVSIEVY
jgi:excisionase family DNA binding protein